MKRSFVIWLTGISGSGKTTLGKGLKARFKKIYGQVEFIDGEQVRDFFKNDLGYTRKERILNVKRIAFASMLIAKNGTPVIVANIAPYYEVRDFIRENIKNYMQVFLRLPLKEAIRRDTKGHYKKFKNGKMKNFIALDDNYDTPRNPDIIVDTKKHTIKESLDKIENFVRKRYKK
ncbi:adenylyl-sulfate kinase [Candidatus Omnitrophota bacterium]